MKKNYIVKTYTSKCTKKYITCINKYITFLNWLNTPSKDYEGWPKRWHFWHPYTGFVGGVFTVIVLILIFSNILNFFI